jgi:carbon storage regulator
MLVLSRKPGEQIQIADTIEVTVLQIHGNRVKIGISAPVDVPIQRKELKRRMALKEDLARAEYGLLAPAANAVA